MLDFNRWWLLRTSFTQIIKNSISIIIGIDFCEQSISSSILEEEEEGFLCQPRSICSLNWMDLPTSSFLLMVGWISEWMNDRDTTETARSALCAHSLLLKIAYIIDHGIGNLSFSRRRISDLIPCELMSDAFRLSRFVEKIGSLRVDINWFCSSWKRVCFQVD